MSEPTSALCCTCPILFPATAKRPEPRKPRRAEVGSVCLGCRNRMESDLRSLIYETETVDHDQFPGGTVLLPPLYAAAYAHLLPGRSGTSQAMSPEFESRPPGSTEVLSMVGPGSVHLTRKAWKVPSDQHGILPVPFLLHQWVQDWRDTRAMRETPPPLHVPAAVRWLLNRLDWACQQHPAVDEFAADLRELVNHLRTVAGRWRLVVRLPEKCPSCDLPELTREDGDDRVECGNCHRLWTLDDYEFLAKVLDAERELERKRKAKVSVAA